MSAERFSESPGVSAKRFVTTRWSVVLGAKGNDTPESRAALETLARAYWYPLYAFLRHRGVDQEEAADVIQSFFAALIEHDALATIRPEGGRFRAYLRTAVLHALSNLRERERAQKRGGAHRVLSIDALDAEQRYRTEPAHEETPEALYEQSWARSVLERAMQRLGHSYRERGQGEWFERLSHKLTGWDHSQLAALAAQFGVTESALKVALHRLRQRYGECLRAEILETLADPSDLEDELRTLFRSLGGQ